MSSPAMSIMTFIHKDPRTGLYRYRRKLPASIAGQPVPDWLPASMSALRNSQKGKANTFIATFTQSLATKDRKQAIRLNRPVLRRQHHGFPCRPAFRRRGAGPLRQQPWKISGWGKWWLRVATRDCKAHFDFRDGLALWINGGLATALCGQRALPAACPQPPDH